MGKIQYKNTPNASVEYSQSKKEKEAISVLQNVKYDDIDKTELADACHQVFDSMVTRDFLHYLSECTVKPLSLETSSYSKVRWYRVDKIVMEKDVFFADKLSMLYMSLHKTARNIILVLNKQNDGDIELYLGARDFSGNSSVSGKILEAGLEGYFPGIKFKQDGITELNFSNPAISSVSAIASLRDDKKEDFVQGIERLINATSSIPQFRAYFVADSVGDAEANSMISAFNNLYSSLSPAETLQMTFNESETKGVSQSFTENFSESIGESISKTVTHTDGYSKNNTESETNTVGSSENYVRNIFATKWKGIVGGRTGNNISNSTSKSSSSSFGENFSESEANQTGSNRNKTKGTANQNGTNESNTIGSSKQITHKNRFVKYYLDILDKQLERIQKGRPFGLWSVATYFVANDPTTAQQLSNIYRGSIIGEESGLESCAINTWTEHDTVTELNRYLANSLHPRFDFNSIDVSAGSVVNSKELAIHLSLPQSSVPGVIVQERASFARNVFSSKKKGEEIRLGNIVHLGKESNTSVNLDIDELTKHLFVTGSTGSGKSNTMYLLLKQLREAGKTFMVIEPAKGEYKNIFGDVNVYGTNPLVTNLLKINPFKFPQGIHVQEHIDRLVEIFNVCWPMYAAMPAVLKKSMLKAYEDCGWDLAMSTNKYSDNLFPTFVDVLEELSSVIKSSEYSADTKGDYIGSLQTRVESLANGINGMIFCGDELGDKRLFDENVIVDLSRIGSQETKSLVMGILVMRLSEYRSVSGLVNSDLRHVTVLEEAHNLLKRCSQEQSQEGSNVAGKAVEMISNSIAEMRTYGEGFIIVDQSPGAVDISTIRNTNTKIVMRLPENEDRKVAGKSCALKDEQIDEIAKLPTGVAVVYQNDWEEPVLCQINKFDDSQAHTFMFDKKEGETTHQYEIPNELIKFMLSGRTVVGLDFDLEMVKKQIWQSQLSNSKKIMLHQAASAYETSKYVKIWDNDMFPELSSILTSLLDINKEIGEALEKSEDFDDLDRRLCDLIHERTDLPFEVDDTVEQCILRDMSLKGESEMTIYNGWLTNKGF